MEIKDKEDFDSSDENELSYEDEQASADFDEGDIELEVVDDTPPEDRNRKPLDREVEDPTDSEIAEYSEKVQKRMKELTHARHDERRAKEAALREGEEAARLAQQLLDENRKLREQYQNGAVSYTQMVQSQAELELQMARQKLREAQESYDTEAIIAAQEGLAEAKYKTERAKTFNPTPLQTQQQEVYIQPTQQQAAQSVPLSEQDVKWQTRNPWFGQDDEMTALALAAHKKLVDSGVRAGTGSYYERIDARMREVFPDYFGETRKEPKRPASVVAAPTRTAGKKKIQLTKTQEALARRLGLTKEQYAREVLKLNSES
jgi:hypothetical protein